MNAAWFELSTHHACQLELAGIFKLANVNTLFLTTLWSLFTFFSIKTLPYSQDGNLIPTGDRVENFQSRSIQVMIHFDGIQLLWTVNTLDLPQNTLDDHN